MSTPFYDLASLVVVPSGYKTSKVYAQKPLTTDGQLTFTRSTGASRVASNGLIEKVRTNLALQSQNFSSGSWLVLNATKVSTANTDPNGGNTACNVTWGAGTSSYLYGSVAQTGYHTVSMWVKSNGGGNNFRLFGDGTALNSANFTATTSWQRFSFAFNAAGGSSWGIRNNSTQDAADLLVAFAQLETGDIATDYIATTSAAVSVGPVANVPRLDYAPTLGQSGVSCPRLLLEPQRTNLITFSEQLDNAAWVKTNVTVTANNAVSPDGYTNADKLIATATSALHICESSTISFTSGTAYTFSFYAKKAENNFVQFTASSSLLATRANYNLLNGTLGTVDSGITATITAAGSDWYRCTATFTAAATGSFRVIIGSITNATAARFQTFAGDGTSGILIYGAQLEAGAYATSYIPTLGAAVTRGADAASKTGISSLIGQTEGTIFVDAQRGSATEFTTISISDGSTNNRVTIAIDAQSAVRSIVVTSGTVQTQISASLTGTRVKAAITYTASGFKLFYNGALVNSSTKAVFGATLSRYGFDQANGGNALFRSVNQTLLFPTALTDAQAIELTTL